METPLHEREALDWVLPPLLASAAHLSARPAPRSAD